MLIYHRSFRAWLALCLNSGPTDGGSGDDDFPSAGGQAGSGGDNNMCPRPFPEHRSTSEGAASSVGGGGDMDQSSAGNTSTRWSNSSRYRTSSSHMTAYM